MVRARQRREISQVSQTGELEKRAGRDQQVMSVVLNEAAIQERIERAVAGGTANELDAGPRDGLALGNDGQHLQRSAGQPHRPRTS